MRVLIDQTYHFSFILGTRRLGDHLEFCTKLAANIVIYRLRQWRLNNVGEELGPLLCEHLETPAE